jgi:hypothetical protein
MHVSTYSRGMRQTPRVTRATPYHLPPALPATVPSTTSAITSATCYHATYHQRQSYHQCHLSTVLPPVPPTSSALPTSTTRHLYNSPPVQLTTDATTLPGSVLSARSPAAPVRLWMPPVPCYALPMCVPCVPCVCVCMCLRACVCAKAQRERERGGVCGHRHHKQQLHVHIL